MPTLAVCSWSLRPRSPAELVHAVSECRLSAVQLALDPIRDGSWSEVETRDRLQGAGISIISGMMGTVGEDYSTLETIARTGGIRPDSTWADNLKNAKTNAAIAQRLGLPLVTFHAGFLPHNRGDSERTRMLNRLREIADIFGSCGVHVAFETGQENADTLVDVMQELNHQNTGVNFDPANMILYGMGEPVTALRKLAPFVRQIHIKDAIPTQLRGTWGQEVAVGTGAVTWLEFFEVAKTLKVDLAIEREAGESRISDIQAARALVLRSLTLS